MLDQVQAFPRPGGFLDSLIEILDLRSQKNRGRISEIVGPKDDEEVAAKNLSSLHSLHSSFITERPGPPPLKLIHANHIHHLSLVSVAMAW